MIASLIGLLFALIIVGVILWGAWELIKMVPLPPPFRIIAIVVMVIICVLIVWHFAGPLLDLAPRSHVLS
jgi:CDP-diglyceride synthetase